MIYESENSSMQETDVVPNDYEARRFGFIKELAMNQQIKSKFLTLIRLESQINNIDLNLVTNRLEKERSWLVEEQKRPDKGGDWDLEAPSEAEEKRSEEERENIRNAAEIYNRFIAEYYIRKVSFDRAEELKNRFIAGKIIPDDVEQTINEATKEIINNRSEFFSFYDLSFLDDEEQEKLWSNNKPLDLSEDVTNIIEQNIDNAIYFHWNDWQVGDTSHYYLMRILGKTRDEAKKIMEEERYHPYLNIGNPSGIPERGLKLHIATGPEDTYFFVILRSVLNICSKNNVPWKSQTMADTGIKEVPKFITIWPTVDENKKPDDTFPDTNVVQTFTIAKEIDNVLIQNGVNDTIGLADTDVQIGKSGRIGIRYGELKPPGGRIYEKTYGQGWKDSRSLTFEKNLPPDMDIKNLYEQAERVGIKFVPEI